ncbi:MAG: DNA alkylation repair protein [Firmicutes bacterium]|jgi:3-methyladenine DNA glycosylase AlkD|nr:DNA alkylation repair protein [Bacillota bacterium]
MNSYLDLLREIIMVDALRELSQHTIKVFSENADSSQSKPMSAYMRDQFPFLGIKSQNRRQLQKEIAKETGYAKKPFSEEFVTLLWRLPEREYQYFAVDYLISKSKTLAREHIDLVGDLITQKSWWDTVDALASNVVGTLCMKYPDMRHKEILQFSESGNIWLIRTSILFQLKYKGKTDTELLAHLIESHSRTGEFFIDKAIGWALRQYARADAKWVLEFLNTHTLAPLSVREAEKHLKRI